MSLVVYGNQDLDEMEAEVIKIFEIVKNKEIGEISYKK